MSLKYFFSKFQGIWISLSCPLEMAIQSLCQIMELAKIVIIQKDASQGKDEEVTNWNDFKELDILLYKNSNELMLSINNYNAVLL